MANAIERMEARFAALENRLGQAERERSRLEQKVDNTNRNIVTAATVSGGIVGALSGLALVAVGGFIPAGAATAKVAGYYLGGAAGGGACGGGVGWLVGEVLVSGRVGETP